LIGTEINVGAVAAPRSTGLLYSSLPSAFTMNTTLPPLPIWSSMPMTDSKVDQAPPMSKVNDLLASTPIPQTYTLPATATLFPWQFRFMRERGGGARIVFSATWLGTRWER